VTVNSRSPTTAPTAALPTFVARTARQDWVRSVGRH
jgi:hypothetical protein